MSDCFLSGSNRRTCRVAQQFKHSEMQKRLVTARLQWPCKSLLTQSRLQQTQQASDGRSLGGMTHNPALTSSLPTLQALSPADRLVHMRYTGQALYVKFLAKLQGISNQEVSAAPESCHCCHCRLALADDHLVIQLKLSPHPLPYLPL